MTPVTPNDSRVRPGESYAHYCERRGVDCGDADERPIPDGPLVWMGTSGAWQPERPADPRDRAKVIAYYRHHGLPLPEWAIAELPPPDPRDERIAALQQQLAELRSDLESVGRAVVARERGAA